MKKLFVKISSLVCALLMMVSIVACAPKEDNTDPATTYPELTFTGHTTALSFEVNTQVTDEQLLQMVSVTSDDGKTYTVAVKDRSALKTDTVGDYQVTIGAKDESNAWVKQSADKEYAVSRTIRIVQPTGIDSDDFTDLKAEALQQQSFAGGAGIYKAERASYDADQGGMVLPSDSYIYAKMSFPEFASRYQTLEDGMTDNQFPYLQKNSSYYVRIDAAENTDVALIQVLLYDENGEMYDLTSAGIVPEGEKFQVLVPDSLLGQDLTLVVYNAVEAGEECNYTVKAIDVVMEEDPKNRTEMFTAMYQYETAVNVREKFQFRSAGFQGWHGISRADVMPGWCASIDSFGINLRYNGHPEESETFTNAGFDGVGAWVKADIRDDVKQIKVEAGCVGGDVAMRVSLFDGEKFTVLSASDESADPAYCAPGEGWMRVDKLFNEQRVYSFKLPEGFAGTQPILVVESKKIAKDKGSEFRLGSVEFSTAEYVEANYIDDIDMSGVAAMQAITDVSVDLTENANRFKAERGAELTNEGIVLSAPAFDANHSYHAVAVAKVTVPEGYTDFKVSLKAEDGKTAAFGVVFFDLKNYAVNDLISMRRVEGSTEFSLSGKCPDLFKGDVGVMFVMSHEDDFEPETYGNVTVTGMEFFNPELITEGVGKDFSHEVLQSAPIVTINEETFKNNFSDNEIFNQWTFVNRSAQSNFSASVNDGAIEFKADYSMNTDWQLAGYIGTQITGDYLKLSLCAYLFNPEGESAAIRAVVYDRETQTFTVLGEEENDGFRSCPSDIAFPSKMDTFIAVPEALQNKDVVVILQVRHGGENVYSIMVYGMSFTDQAQ